MTASFHSRRRQQFITESYGAAALLDIEDTKAELGVLLNDSGADANQRRGWAFYLAQACYQDISIRYTAGASIDDLRSRLSDAVTAYERYQKALGEYEQIPDAAPLGLGRLEDYQRCMQLIGLCYLLHRRDLLPRIAALEDPAYAAEDVLYEELLDYEIPGRFDVDMLKFVDVYDPLIQAMFAESPAQATDAVARYGVTIWQLVANPSR